MKPKLIVDNTKNLTKEEKEILQKELEEVRLRKEIIARTIEQARKLTW